MFFTQINHLMNQGVDLTLVIRKSDGQLTVAAMPKSNGLKDEAQNHIVPFTVTGTPEELDLGFTQAISQPIQKATGLLTNMNDFEQQAEKAEANSKATKELKEKEAKEAKEKKEKFDKHMKNATDLEAEKKYAEALVSIQQARTFSTPQALKSVDDKITALKNKQGQGSLFGMEDDSQQPPMNFHPNSDPDPEPVPVFVADYSAHREGEYDRYPDFPGYANNKRYHPINY